MTETKPDLKNLLAKDIMNPNVVSVKSLYTLDAVLELLDKGGFSAFPVVNDKNSLIGVISRTDIIKFLHSKLNDTCRLIHSYRNNNDLEQTLGDVYGELITINDVKTVKVKELMTTFVYAVGYNTPSMQLIKEMSTKKLHRLYVLDDEGHLSGVISTLDVFKILSTT